MQDAIAPYAEKLTELLQNLSATLEGEEVNLLHSVK
jgi:hypothetical protein